MRVEKCPWCNSKFRVPNDIFADTTNHYITTILGTTPEQAVDLLKLMKGFQCLSCKTTYLDPWLSPEGLTHFFSNQKSVHRAGWGNFRSLLIEGFTSPASEVNIEILKILEPEFNVIEKYIEVGCPFMGMLGTLSALQSGESIGDKFLASKKRFFSDNYYSRKFVRLSRLNNFIEMHFTKWLVILSALKYRLKNVEPSPSFLQIRNRTGLHESAIELIVTSPKTHLMWRDNCVGETGTCISTSVNTFGVKNMIWEEISASRNEKRDRTLIAFFNTLDHQLNGAIKLKESFNFAKYILIETHTNSHVEKQHSFVIQDTINSLDPLMYRVRDLSLESEKLKLISKDHYYLISLI